MLALPFSKRNGSLALWLSTLCLLAGCNRTAPISGASATSVPNNTLGSLPVAVSSGTRCLGSGSTEGSTFWDADLVRVVQAARHCALQPPSLGLGRAGTSLVFDRFVQLRPVGRTSWVVQFTELDPKRRPYGLELTIDESWRCDGRDLGQTTLPSPREPVIRANAILSCARRCSVDGRGVSGSPLRFDAPTIGYRGTSTSLLVHFPEASPAGAPTGLDVGVDPDATDCAPALMD